MFFWYRLENLVTTFDEEILILSFNILCNMILLLLYLVIDDTYIKLTNIVQTLNDRLFVSKMPNMKN